MVGMGGWVPHEARATATGRYGDCNDKANLLRALLRHEGIDSDLVAIYADDVPRPLLLPVLGLNTNHQILRVRLDDGDVLVDPTTRTTAFGELPASDEDRMCHPFTKAGEEPIPTHSTSFEHDVLRRTWSFAMDGRGDVTGSVVAVAAGDFADTVRDLMLGTSGVAQRQALSTFLGVAGAVSATSIDVDDATPPVLPLPVTLRATLRSSTTSSSSSLPVLWPASSFVAPAVPTWPADRPSVPLMLAGGSGSSTTSPSSRNSSSSRPAPSTVTRSSRWSAAP